MEELSAFKKTIKNLLVEKIGILSDSDQTHLKKQAQTLGLDNRQFSALLQEIHLSINWDALRDERQGRDRVVRPIHIFGVEVRSLEKLGEVLYENQVKALKYLEDAVFLKENVTYLSHQNVDQAMELMELHSSERNSKKRFLKICYQLNAELPFKVGEESFSNIKGLLDWGWMGIDFFSEIYNKFAIGHLQIWIHRRFNVLITILPSGESFRDFLYFIYTIEPNYPFYVESELFLQPGDLVTRAKRDATFWLPLFAALDHGSLSIWLERRGMGEVISKFEKYAAGLLATEKKSEELSRNLVQKLLEALAPDMEVPDLSAAVEKLSFLNIQDKPLFNPIVVRLNNKGFVRATVGFERDIPGVWISPKNLTLSDLEGKESVTFHLNVDPSRLIKDHLYTLSLKIQTDYQSVRIPLALKTVFPMRAFMLCLLRYGGLGTFFLCIIRLLITAAYSGSGWLKPQLVWNDFSAQLPANHLVYVLIFIVAILVPLLAWPRIKKIEQI
ncbi:hypothetical protein GJU39_15950 [Pedobacter petrophilus]|uniref:Uncharacterized protein n=1 Tax=Pedobacter petrophilus TaxID=1908241 RepID=A0A7K0G1Q7_9SPHI|nr:hypothetical protein [Pedobacter petrophilus]MRX77581.1 hypothetical protein [Pedobacter petrophilus]